VEKDVLYYKSQNDVLKQTKEAYVNLKIDHETLRKNINDVIKERDQIKARCEELDQVSKKYMDVSNSQTQKINTFKKEFEKLKRQHEDNMNDHKALQKQ